jgi:hypothetical protein
VKGQLLLWHSLVAKRGQGQQDDRQHKDDDRHYSPPDSWVSSEHSEIEMRSYVPRLLVHVKSRNAAKATSPASCALDRIHPGYAKEFLTGNMHDCEVLDALLVFCPRIAKMGE